MSFDLIIIGAGFAGLTVANRAAELGLKPLVLEAGADELYRCNSRFSTGSCHVAFQTPWTEPAVLSKSIIENTGGAAREDLAETIGINAARTIDWLKDQGASFEDHPRRTDHMPMLSPLREMKAGLDWEGGGANALLQKLGAKLIERGGELRRGIRALSLIQTDGKVIGIEAISEAEPQTLSANAIVIADGGFQANAELVKQNIGCDISHLQCRNAGTGVGDGMRMATEIGAEAVGLDSFYGHVLSRDAMTNEKLWPYPQVDLICATNIVVDSDGQRFADEGLGGISIANAIARLDDPLSATTIFDARTWEDAKTTDNVPPPNPSLPDAGGTVIEAATLRELADAASINAAGLSVTIALYNEHIAYSAGPALSPIHTQTTYTAQPIIDPPFYAIPVCAGITVTSGGLSVNGRGQVMDTNDQPITGLHAAGSTVGGLEGGPRAAYVGGLIKSFCIGLLAAETIAAGHGSP
ncbi:MAG: FAD-dependent oxidoreductase [Alphaproteobacteria bacterium]|nr:FAD-dependent oxidoreductase [Alphaproteobacteria bacterium]